MPEGGLHAVAFSLWDSPLNSIIIVHKIVTVLAGAHEHCYYFTHTNSRHYYYCTRNHSSDSWSAVVHTNSRHYYYCTQ